MADAILMAGGTGGVTSDDVTASKAHVLKGYKTVTTESNDEIVEGEMVNRGNGMDTVEFVDAYWDSKYLARMEQGYYAQNGQWKPYVGIPYAVLANGIHLDANKMLDTLQVSGVRGTIPVRGYKGLDTSEMWLYPQEGGYVVRVEEGYYHKSGDGLWKPYVIAPTALVKSAVNYHPEYTLNNTTTCGEQGKIKMINTQDNGYTINQARVLAIDGGRGKLVMIMGHGNAYYFRPDGNPHVEANASELGTAVKESVLQGQTASSQYGINFQGTIPRWICNTGDVISAVNNEGFAWDDATGANRGRGIVTKIPNGHFIQGANYAFLPSPNLYHWNIRAGVNIHGITGTLQDYGAGGQAFRAATFDGRLLTGVANKGFVLNGIGRYLNLKNSGYGYQGIVDGGLKFINGYGENTRLKTAPDIGCVFSRSVNLTPFRFIKFGFKVFTFRGDGTNSQPAGIDLEVGATPIGSAGGETYHNASNTIVKDIGGRSKFISYTMISRKTDVGNQSDMSQQYLTLDVSASQGHHFIYIMLGNIVHEYTRGSVYAVVVVNNIEFIN